MLCILEILAVIYGIMTLVRGRFSFGKHKEVRGPAAYVIGVVLLGTIPVAVLAAIIINFDAIMKGDQNAFQFGNLNWKTWLPDVIGVVFGWGTTLVIAIAKSEPKIDDRLRRRDDEYDDYEDDRPRRRRGPADDDDDFDQPRRPRHEEDDDFRPRRGDDLDERAR